MLFARAPSPTFAERLPALTTLLQNYARAAADPGAPELKQLTISGTISAGGLNGTFTTWRESDRERTDERLGPREDRTLRLGDRYWYEDPSGNARELTGSLKRRARTERFIEAGDFARRPDRCVLRGRSVVRQHPAFVLDVTADDGETQTLYLDAHTYLPARVAYDEDDGRTTIDLSDWRSVAGRRYSFSSVESDGDPRFDTVQTTQNVDTATPVDPATFAPFVTRVIEMTAPETVALGVRDGHLYAPVTIGGHAYEFLLDSGAQNVLLDRRVATALGLASVGTFEASGAARTGGLQLTNVPELLVGKRGKLSRLMVTTFDLTAGTGGALHADGILGYPFFAAATVRLDVAGHSMTFGPPGTVALEGERLGLDVDRGLAELTLQLNATTAAPFVIDTGNAGGLLLYRPFELRHRGIVPYSATRHESYGLGGAAPSYHSALERIDFGDIALYHVDADVMLSTSGAFADRTDAGNVGLGVLRNFVLTFDYAHTALYVERGAEYDEGKTRN